jgi:hypothetical protein
MILPIMVEKAEGLICKARGGEVVEALSKMSFCPISALDAMI